MGILRKDIQIHKNKDRQDYLGQRIAFDGDCWLYTGTVTADGCGRVPVRMQDGSSRWMSPKRAAYLYANDVIPAYHAIKNTCGNKLCVNPEHMILVEWGYPPEEEEKYIGN